MYHHWGCTQIYWQLSYPFRSLILLIILNFRLKQLTKNSSRFSRTRKLQTIDRQIQGLSFYMYFGLFLLVFYRERGDR